ncbi:MAG TPA: non-ribosomal peptide synthetase [Terriglobales bacterium]|nr:non-ribosomal peptide synthetase [Terriglobales bacterium]
MKLEKVTSELISGKVSSSMKSSEAPLARWNATSREYPQDMVVAELVSEQAHKTPNALAVASDTQTLSYGELDSRANHLATRLQFLGVGPEALVGICLPRSPEMIVAALAVLKAGGAYVPIDAEYPLERQLFMLRDTQLRVLILQDNDEAAQQLPAGDWQVLILNAEHEAVPKGISVPLPAPVSLQNLAYVIYTSGSTGQPKGVQITHRGLLNLIYWHRRAFSITAADRASQVASFGFDAAVWEVWPYLTAGASVHFPNDATRGSAKSLRDWLLEKEITVSFVPTAVAESLLELDWPAQLPLRLLLTGADTLHRYPPSNLPFALINNYGPTECTVVSTSGVVLPDVGKDRQPSIGRPIDNVQVHILDDQLEPVPVGEVGELFIGGDGLARGYLNRPEQNADAFIPNPFSDLENDRLYRTGDLARYLPDGQIAFVGRTDEQVKIRGYRIEPNEIVMRLNQYPGVQTSQIVARTEASGEKRLVAYLVSDETRLTRSALQDYLRSYLPDYMVPAAFVRLDSMPLKASGKVDRSLLPAPTSTNTIDDDVYIAPRTAVERRVVSILAELLGIEKVGVNDNFFFLGGHSLLGTQLIARARDSFRVELPLRTVFDRPTAAELSAEIERMIRTDSISAD